MQLDGSLQEPRVTEMIMEKEVRGEVHVLTEQELRGGDWGQAGYPSFYWSPEGLQKQQQEDHTLAEVRKVAYGTLYSAGMGFYVKDGLLYSRWRPPGQHSDEAVEQGAPETLV